jgi:predicted RNase H-like HicB family nuclease
MATAAGTSRSARDQARWFRRPGYHGAVRVWHQTVTVRGATFQARLRACDDGGWVVTFPALPQLMARGVTRQHARIKALALVEGYLRRLPARSDRASTKTTAERQRGLPLAA